MSAPPPGLASSLADRYRVERELGAGGMATVYLAHDLKHDRQVAIKVLRPELAAVIGADRFLTEIRTTARLQHPHILPLHDSGQVDGLLYYVMPFVSGESLRDRLQRETQLPIGDAVRIATEIAGALDYAHRQGIIHRDIKPENILLHDGRALVADFGIALATTSATSRMTETGMSLGTPHYMSPEQAMGDRELTPRSDVYALGALTYEMLLGEPPFTGPTVQSIVAKVMTETPAAIVSRRRSVPAAVQAAVLTALEKLPADRFESTAKFADALADPTFSAPGAGRPAAAPTVQAALWKRIGVGVAAAAGASLLFAAGTIWRDDPGPVAPAVVRFALSTDPGLHVVTQISAPFGLSPDGRTLVLSAVDSAGRTALWVRTMDDPTLRRLQGGDDGTHPAVSPDGQWVAFVGGNRLLSKTRITGGSSMVLAELPGVSASLSWASDDEILAEVIAPSRQIHSVAANGGPATVAVPFDSAAGEVRQRRPLVLRESQMVLYTGTTRDDSASVVMYSRRDGRYARLGVDGAPLAVIDGLLVLSSGGALHAVPIDVDGMRIVGAPAQLSQRAGAGETGTAAALSESGTLVYADPSDVTSSRLELVDPAGRRTQLRDEDRYGAPRYSRDGARIAVVIGTAGTRGVAGGSDLWVIDLATKQAVRVTSGGNANFPEWSADDTRLIYVAAVDGRREIWSASVDGGPPPARLVRIDGDVVSAVPTPDRRSLIVSRWADGDARLELLRVSLDGSPEIDTLVSPSGPNDIRPASPRVSPDGRLVAFSDRSRSKVHVRTLDGRSEIQISTAGGCCPLWAVDSRRVHYRDGDRLVSVDLRIEPTLSVADRASVPGFWTADGGTTGIYADVHYDLSPLGHGFVAVTPVSSAARVYVAYNWGEELRREWRAGGGR